MGVTTRDHRPASLRPSTSLVRLDRRSEIVRAFGKIRGELFCSFLAEGRDHSVFYNADRQMRAGEHQTTLTGELATEHPSMCWVRETLE